MNQLLRYSQKSYEDVKGLYITKKQYFDVAKMIFREKEGVTLIIEKEKIDETVPFTFECYQITLNIHSSLEAVGFLR